MVWLGRTYDCRMAGYMGQREPQHELVAAHGTGKCAQLGAFPNIPTLLPTVVSLANPTANN